MRMRWSGGPEGWGGFATEIAVVVIGVGIALGAQQLVEMSNDRSRADRAIAALRTEVEDIEFTASEIQIAAPCIQAQLDRISRQLVANDRTPLERYGNRELSGGSFVVRTPARVWSTDNWQSVNASDVLRRIEPERNRHLAQFYSSAVNQRESNDRIRSGVHQLDALSILVPQDEAQRFRLLTLIEEMRGEVSLMDLRAGQLRDRLAAARILLSDRELAKLLSESGTLKFCREKALPLGKLRRANAAYVD